MVGLVSGITRGFDVGGCMLQPTTGRAFPWSFLMAGINATRMKAKQAEVVSLGGMIY